jgi:aspartate aminotransferase
MVEILVESHVDAITMPENLRVGNLRVGLMISEHRRKCVNNGCNFDYYGFAFGQSPFHVPPPLARPLGTCK